MHKTSTITLVVLVLCTMRELRVHWLIPQPSVISAAYACQTPSISTVDAPQELVRSPALPVVAW